MKLLTAALLASSAAAFAPAASNSRASVAVSESKADLEVLAKELNPLVGYFDPLELGSDQFWEQSNEATIGFLREAEIKHGRIAMFAFVGYIVHANGITFPWNMQLDGTPFPTVSSAPEAWDQISDAAKWQIFGFIGFLEFVSRCSCVVEFVLSFSLQCKNLNDFDPLLTIAFTFTNSFQIMIMLYELYDKRSTMRSQEPTTCEEESPEISLTSMPLSSLEAPSTFTILSDGPRADLKKTRPLD